jgi:hypothetical protein
VNALHPRDERQHEIDLQGDRLAYLVVSFGLLLIVAVRAFAAHETSWDLLALVVLGGVVDTAWTASRHAVTRSWAGIALVAVVVGAGCAVLAVLFSRG